MCDQVGHRERGREPTSPNISRTKAEQAVETVFESLKTALGRGQRIELRRFGVFSVKPRKTGIGRNPRTGEEVNIPPGKAVRFKPGKELQGLEAPQNPRNNISARVKSPPRAVTRTNYVFVPSCLATVLFLLA